MKEDIVIPRKNIERLRIWSAHALDALAWLICLGMLAASAASVVCGSLAWLVFRSGDWLLVGIGGGILLGLAAAWQLVRRLEISARGLKGIV